MAVMFSVTAMSIDNEPFIGRDTKDPYPLQHILKYELVDKANKSEIQLINDIIENLDIEKNERYFQVGVKFIDKKAYEIPIQEVEDFNLNVDYYNTYCNIFVIDVLNILANTTGDETFRILKTPVSANNMRSMFEDSKYWEEVNRGSAITSANLGSVVVMSYVNDPHGHVAIVRQDSTKDELYLWNVGAENKEKLLWKVENNVKYFKHK
jgi:hypothetical protein